METTKLVAEVRHSRGKGPARRLRNEGKIPAVFYGAGVESTPLTVNPDDVVTPLRGVYGRNSVFALEFGGRTEPCMVRDVEVEPVTRALLHVDFFRVDPTTEIVVNIPLVVTGRSVGVVKGGILNVPRRSVSVRCTTAHIPAELVIDITNLDVNDTFQVKDLTLPEGVTCTNAAALTLANVFEDKRVTKAAEKDAKAPAAGKGKK